jgi:hypothetical protein
VRSGDREGRAEVEAEAKREGLERTRAIAAAHGDEVEAREAAEGRSWLYASAKPSSASKSAANVGQPGAPTRPAAPSEPPEPRAGSTRNVLVDAGSTTTCCTTTAVTGAPLDCSKHQVS